jgi:signal transduction histidine kinase/ActR/RegA family two-component response regulator
MDSGVTDVRMPPVDGTATAPGPEADALLAEYCLPDDAPVEQLRAVTRVAATVAGVPNAVVNLLSSCFQHQVGEVGFAGGESAVSDSMCAVALQDERLRYLPDAQQEPAFAGNPWVDGRLASLGLYATAPMVLPDGRVLGSLCVFSEEPGHLTPGQLNALTDLAGQAVALFEQSKLARELTEARDQALAATRAKTAFLAAASHEIRTPLNGVLGMLEMLSLESLASHQHEYVQVARHSGEALLHLLNDVLDLSKAETISVVLASEPFRPVDMATEVVAAMEATARNRGLDLQLTGEAAVEVVGDVRRLRQILMNLIGNAIKFTESGRVDVAVSVSSTGELRVAVSDTGAGMSADELGRLFQPFTQGAQGARHGGTGLGLALSRQLVELMGGRIDVASEPGSGSTFTVVVDLPLAASTRSQTAPPADLLSSVEPSRHEAATGVRRPRVLVADDNEINLMVASGLLAAEGAEVVTVADGDEAVDAVRDGAFDVVLLDLQMPRMSGLEAAMAIRALPGPAGRTRVLALTAETIGESEAACRGAGMDGVLVKPIRGADVRRVLAELPALPPS